MIAIFKITKPEAVAIMAKLKDVPVTVCNRQKTGGRKKYYVEDTQKVRSFLYRLNNDKQ